jgi:hypothetical protein
MDKWILIFLVLLCGCTAYSNFTPSVEVAYDARPADFPIAFYADTEPDTTFIVIGFAEARGTTVAGALPLLKKLARKHGGSAIMSLKQTNVQALAMNYSVTIIRYK